MTKTLKGYGQISLAITALMTLIAAWDTIVMLSEFAAWTMILSGGVYLLVLLGKHIIVSINDIKLSNATTKDAIQASRFGLMDQEADLLFKTSAIQSVVNLIGSGVAIPAQFADTTFHKLGNAVGKASPEQVAASDQLQPLLPALAHCDNVLVVGGKGTGKTTLLQWLESQRAQSGRTIVLDSHAQPAQWLGQMVGLGREYDQIRGAMIRLVETLDQRYQHFSRGTTGFEPIHTFIDEFTLLPRALADTGYNVQHYSIPALTEGRKVGLNCVWGIHSDRVKALGLEGAGDLKECFDAVVYLKRVKGQHYALCDFGEGKEEVKYAHPGPFTMQAQVTSAAIDTEVAAPSVIDGIVADVEMTETEREIIDLHEDGKSVSAIAADVYGSKGSHNNGKVKDVLARFGRV